MNRCTAHLAYPQAHRLVLTAVCAENWSESKQTRRVGRGGGEAFLSSRAPPPASFYNSPQSFRARRFPKKRSGEPVGWVAGTLAMSGSEAIRLTNLAMHAMPSSIPSSMLMSKICAPFSTCSLATASASCRQNGTVDRTPSARGTLHTYVSDTSVQGNTRMPHSFSRVGN